MLESDLFDNYTAWNQEGKDWGRLKGFYGTAESLYLKVNDSRVELTDGCDMWHESPIINRTKHSYTPTLGQLWRLCLGFNSFIIKTNTTQHANMLPQLPTQESSPAVSPHVSSVSRHHNQLTLSRRRSNPQRGQKISGLLHHYVTRLKDYTSAPKQFCPIKFTFSFRPSSCVDSWAQKTAGKSGRCFTSFTTIQH